MVLEKLERIAIMGSSAALNVYVTMDSKQYLLLPLLAWPFLVFVEI